MTYIYNGKKITKAQAIEKIYNLVPNGGLRYVETIVADAKDEGRHSVELMAGSFRMIIRF